MLRKHCALYTFYPLITTSRHRCISQDPSQHDFQVHGTRTFSWDTVWPAGCMFRGFELPLYAHSLVPFQDVLNFSRTTIWDQRVNILHYQEPSCWSSEHLTLSRAILLILSLTWWTSLVFGISSPGFAYRKMFTGLVQELRLFRWKADCILLIEVFLKVGGEGFGSIAVFPNETQRSYPVTITALNK